MVILDAGCPRASTKRRAKFAFESEFAMFSLKLLSQTALLPQLVAVHSQIFEKKANNFSFPLYDAHLKLFNLVKF